MFTCIGICKVESFNILSAYYWNCCVWTEIYIRFILSHNGMASINFEFMFNFTIIQSFFNVQSKCCVVTTGH